MLITMVTAPELLGPQHRRTDEPRVIHGNHGSGRGRFVLGARKFDDVTAWVSGGTRS